MSKVKFTDSNGQDQVEEMVVIGGTTTADGSAAGLVVAEIQQSAGILETRTFTINAATDCITTATAPAIAELLTADSFTAGKKRCRVTFHVQQGAAATQHPHAAAVLVTLNAGDDATAVSRLTYVDVGAAGTGSIDTRQRYISAANPVIEFDLTQTGADVDRVDLGGVLPEGTGVLPVYISVEVW